MMKIVATGYGDPDRLAVVTARDEAPGDGEIAVTVRAAGVNPVDRKRYADADYARSHGQDDPTFPIELGVEIAGVVTAVGANANGPAGPIAAGDEVIGFRVAGGYADRIVTSAANVVPKPSGMSWAQAATMMLAGTTGAHTLAAVRARSRQTILVHGAGGAVGTAILQLAHIESLRVIGTAREKDCERIRRLGAEPVLSGAELADRVRALAPGGIDAAIDLIGTDDVIDASLALVADRSRIATIVAFDRARHDGFQALGGAPGQDDTGIAIRMNARLRLTALAQAGAYVVSDPRTLPLDRAAEAHRLLDEGGAGKLALLPSP